MLVDGRGSSSTHETYARATRWRKPEPTCGPKNPMDGRARTMTLFQLSPAAPHVVELGLPKLAAIGAGDWGKNIVRNFAALKALAAVVDQDRLTAQALCATHGGAAASFEDVLADVSITAVAVAPPAILHHRFAK